MSNEDTLNSCCAFYKEDSSPLNFDEPHTKIIPWYMLNLNQDGEDFHEDEGEKEEYYFNTHPFLREFRCKTIV